MRGPRITAQLPLRSLTLVLAATFVLTALGGQFYVLKRPQAARDALADTLFETRRGRAHDVPGEDAIAALEADIDSLSRQLGGGGPQLPANEMVAYVIGQLDLLARGRAIQLVSVEPGAVTRVLEFDEIPFHIEVIGGYFSLVDWMQDAERELGPMVIKSFDIEPVPASDARRMRLTMVSYRNRQGDA